MGISVKTYSNPYLSPSNTNLQNKIVEINPFEGIGKEYMNILQDNGIDYPKWSAMASESGSNGGFFSGINSFMDYLKSIKEVGFFQTVYGKSFPKVVGDFLLDVGKEVGLFILKTGDLLFLIPAVGFMFVTFFAGNNRFTKWIIPLWLAYFATVFFYKLATQ